MHIIGMCSHLTVQLWPLLYCILGMSPVVLHISLHNNGHTLCYSLDGLQVRHLINALNEATNHIPGWDEYSATGKAAQLWDGNL